METSRQRGGWGGAHVGLRLALAVCALGSIPLAEVARTFPTRYETPPSAWPEGGIPIEVLLASVELRWTFTAAFALALFGGLLAGCALLALPGGSLGGRGTAASARSLWWVAFAPVAAIYFLAAALMVAGALANGGWSGA